MANKKTLYLFIVLLAAVLVMSLYFAAKWLHTPINKPQANTVFHVPAGASVKAVANALFSEEVIDWPDIWLLYARYIENKKPIKVGEFQLTSVMTPAQVLQKLQGTDVIQYQVTLVEGLRFQDYVLALSKHSKIQSILVGKTQAEQLALLNINVAHPEGWFFPDTYQFTADTNDVDVLRIAHKKMKTVLNEAWQNKEKDLPYESAYEALIMASIVEKETGAAHERKEIAGVFVRRLNKKMRLQTDPTVIYGLGDAYDGDIKRKHLKAYTPYNTYVIKGLPPTPIASPGKAAIEAALNPKAGSSLFFVGKGDGTHQFSDTLEAHNKAVREYQINRRVKNYRSSPPVEKKEQAVP